MLAVIVTEHNYEIVVVENGDRNQGKPTADVC